MSNKERTITTTTTALSTAITAEAEKEASEVLHSLLSVERINQPKLMSNDNVQIITSGNKSIKWHVSVNSDENDGKLKPTPIQDDIDNDDSQSDTIDVESTDPQDTTNPFLNDRKLMLNNNYNNDNNNNNDDGEDITKTYNKSGVKRKQKNIKSIMKTELPSSVSSDEQSTSDTENTCEAVTERFERGCDCTENCFNGLSVDNVYRHRLNIAELTKEEHDMYLMGVTMSCVAFRKRTRRNKERQRQRASYNFQGKKVCLDAFLFFENLTIYHLKCIRQHVMINGVTPRVHGNIGKKPHNTFSLNMYKCADQFVKSMLNIKCNDLNRNIIVPGETRSSVYNKFKENFHKNDHRNSMMNENNPEKIMGYPTFRHFMNKQFPNVKFVPSKNIDQSITSNINSSNFNNNNNNNSNKMLKDNNNRHKMNINSKSSQTKTIVLNKKRKKCMPTKQIDENPTKLNDILIYDVNNDGDEEIDPVTIDDTQKIPLNQLPNNKQSYVLTPVPLNKYLESTTMMNSNIVNVNQSSASSSASFAKQTAYFLTPINTVSGVSSSDTILIESPVTNNTS